MSAKVVTLAHVKAPTNPATTGPGAESCPGKRIAWPGGKITSNKVEALRKFYERKMLKGESFTPQQALAVKETLGIDVSSPQAAAIAASLRRDATPVQDHTVSISAPSTRKRKLNPKKKLMSHRPHAKVLPEGHAVKRTVLMSGRVIGPRTSHGHRDATTPMKQSKSSVSRGKRSALGLQEKLTMPLDALVKSSSS